MRITVLIKPGAELEDSDACAVEHALRIARRRLDVQVTLLTAGPSSCVRALRTALALGADDAVHVADPTLSPHDALTLSRVLASTVAEQSFDLILCGAASDIPNQTMIPAMVAARLRIPAHCHVVASDSDLVDVPALPALVSVPACSTPPRHPPFPAIAEARQKLISTRIPSDHLTPVISVNPAIAKRNTIINAAHDPRSAAVQLVDFLAERRFI